MEARGPLLRAIAAGLFAFGVGCILNLNEDVACGDGYVDLAAGEECDPLVPESFESACAELMLPLGTAACDTQSCTIIATAEQCAVCGDGNVDPETGEECDGDNLDGKACPLGGALQCQNCRFDFSLCEKCGNGVVDDGEECDPKKETGEFVDPVSCVGLTPLVKPYASGSVTVCKESCQWLRTTCGYCGDGVRDDATQLDPDVLSVMSEPEVCDKTDEPEEGALTEHCSSVCGSNLELKCAFSCRPDCKGFDGQAIAPADLGCCRKQGQPCPGDGEEFPCCWSLANTGHEPGEECETIIDNGIVQDFCR